MKKGQREEPCIWFFVLIYSVVSVKTLFSLGLGFIFSKKAMASLALPDHTVPGKEKHTRGMWRPGLSMAAHAFHWSERDVSVCSPDLLSCHRAVVRMTFYVY